MEIQQIFYFPGVTPYLMIAVAYPVLHAHLSALMSDLHWPIGS